jgi:hypothetical protein
LQPNHVQQIKWWGSQTTATTPHSAVTQLAPLERLVFVMSVLEGYSIKEGSLLLNCTQRTIMKTKMRAFRKLALFQAGHGSPIPDLYRGGNASIHQWREYPVVREQA